MENQESSEVKEQTQEEKLESEAKLEAKVAEVLSAESETEESQITSPLNLFKSAFDFYSKNLTKMIFIYVAPFILLVVTLLLGSNTPKISIILMSIIYLFVNMLAPFALLFFIDKNADDSIDTFGYYKLALKSFIPLAMIGFFVVVTVLGGIVLLFIPGIYVGILLSLSTYVFIVEGKKNTSALVQSWYYVKGHWWAVFGRYLLIPLASLVVMLVVKIIFSILGVDFMVDTISSNGNIVQGMSSVGQFVMNVINSFIVTPIALVYSYRLYQSLKSTKKEPISQEEEKKIKTNIKIFSIITIIVIILSLIFIAGLIGTLLSGFVTISR